VNSFDPFLRSTVTKWSDKVLAASGLALKGGDKKFKAVNQNAMAQIDHALSGAGERERLIRRTRIRRAEGKVVGALANDKVEEKELEGEKKAEKEVDEECFDDSDFYQQLLRDVVESRMLDLGACCALWTVLNLH
jgi:protein AATF/BFR2